MVDLLGFSNTMGSHNSRMMGHLLRTTIQQANEPLLVSANDTGHLYLPRVSKWVKGAVAAVLAAVLSFSSGTSALADDERTPNSPSKKLSLKDLKSELRRVKLGLEELLRKSDHMLITLKGEARENVKRSRDHFDASIKKVVSIDRTMFFTDGLVGSHEERITGLIDAYDSHSKVVSAAPRSDSSPDRPKPGDVPEPDATSKTDRSEELNKKLEEILNKAKEGQKENGSNGNTLPKRRVSPDRPDKIHISDMSGGDAEVMKSSNCGKYFNTLLANGVDFSKTMKPLYAPEAYEEVSLSHTQTSAFTEKEYESGERIICPDGFVPTAAKSEDGQAIKIFFDSANQQYKIQFSGGLKKVTIWWSHSKDRKVFHPEEDNGMIDKGMQYVPSSIRNQLEKARSLSPTEKSEVLRRIFSQFSYTLNQRLAEKFEENAKNGICYLESFFEYQAGDCDVLSAVYYLMARFLGLEVKVMFGFADFLLPSGEITTKESHGWIYDFGLQLPVEVTSLVQKAPLTGDIPGGETYSNADLDTEMELLKELTKKRNKMENPDTFPEVQQYNELKKRYDAEIKNLQVVLEDKDSSVMISRTLRELRQMDFGQISSLVELVASAEYHFEILKIVIAHPNTGESEKREAEEIRNKLFRELEILSKERPLYFPWDNFRITSQKKPGEDYVISDGHLKNTTTGEILFEVGNDVQLKKFQNGYAVLQGKDSLEVKKNGQSVVCFVRGTDGAWTVRAPEKNDFLSSQGPGLFTRQFENFSVYIENGLELSPSDCGELQEPWTRRSRMLKVFVSKAGQVYFQFQIVKDGRQVVCLMKGFGEDERGTIVQVNTWTRGVEIFSSIDDEQGGGVKCVSGYPKEMIYRIWQQVTPLNEPAGWYLATKSNGERHLFGEGLPPQVTQRPFKSKPLITLLQNGQKIVSDQNDQKFIWFSEGAPESFDSSQEVNGYRFFSNLKRFAYCVMKSDGRWYLRGEIPREWREISSESPLQLYELPDGSRLFYRCDADSYKILFESAKYASWNNLETTNISQPRELNDGGFGLMVRPLSGDPQTSTYMPILSTHPAISLAGCQEAAFLNSMGQTAPLVIVDTENGVELRGAVPEWIPPGPYEVSGNLHERRSEKKVRDGEYRGITLSSFDDGRDVMAIVSNFSGGKNTGQVVHVSPRFYQAFSGVEISMEPMYPENSGSFGFFMVTEKGEGMGLIHQVMPYLARRGQICSREAFRAMESVSEKIAALGRALELHASFPPEEVMECFYELLQSPDASYHDRQEVLRLMAKHWWDIGEVMIDR